MNNYPYFGFTMPPSVQQPSPAAPYTGAAPSQTYPIGMPAALGGMGMNGIAQQPASMFPQSSWPGMQQMAPLGMAGMGLLSASRGPNARNAYAQAAPALMGAGMQALGQNQGAIQGWLSSLGSSGAGA